MLAGTAVQLLSGKTRLLAAAGLHLTAGPLLQNAVCHLPSADSVGAYMLETNAHCT